MYQAHIDRLQSARDGYLNDKSGDGSVNKWAAMRADDIGKQIDELRQRAEKHEPAENARLVLPWELPYDINSYEAPWEHRRAATETYQQR